MSSFTKLSSLIATSTIMGEDAVTFKVFILLLALADRDGIVEATVPGLGRLANLRTDEVEASLEKLMSADKYSRTRDHDGRRVQAIDGGWLLLNHAKYRAKMSPEETRERDRLRKQRYRSTTCPTKSGTKRDKSECPANSDIAEAEAEAEIQPVADFDGSEWALKTFRVYPTWGDPDATVVPARLGEAYMQTMEAEAPARGGLLPTAQWFFDVTQEHARQSAGKDPKFVMSLEKFLRQGYAEVKMPARAANRYIPAESDEECESRLRAEARQRRSAAQEAIAG